MIYSISKKDRNLKGGITLNGSKSISNRALIIRALCGQHFAIKNLSTSKDSELMQALLASKNELLDAGAAGTTFRFLTAYLATQPGTQILTGTERMKKRPIGVLVEALKKLGADIEYLEEKGFPPLKIRPPKDLGKTSELSIPADTSSQYLSALLMIAPTLPNGLTLNLEGNIVSRPYLEMTLRMMEYFGVGHEWEGNCIKVAPQTYVPKDFLVEADWSAASYWYAMAAFSEDCDLTLHGLFADSLQGDSVLPEMMESFGVASEFGEGFVRLRKSSASAKPIFEWDFLPCPDLAQTLAVVCAGLGVSGVFTGLETLRIKETDRINALQMELSKVQVALSMLPARFSKKSNKEHYIVQGKAVVENAPVFATYEDHRMAMAFAPLAMFGEIKIEGPGVVEKSYPVFWEDMEKVGFVVGRE
ncbi:MAG TPA: 3-phosphoshikimate 1-carboxyvinyltransferase [Bacteroidetes bacterium]|nr:3-phosphoshikimate 1-carboxyvinyltransferase [Bacteroidota bacterium]